MTNAIKHMQSHSSTHIENAFIRFGQKKDPPQTGFPGNQPPSFTRTSLSSQNSPYQASPVQPVFSQDEVLFGKNSDKPQENPLPSNPALPTKQPPKDFNPNTTDTLNKTNNRSAFMLGTYNDFLKNNEPFILILKRHEFAEQIRVAMVLNVPVPEQFYYGYVMNSTAPDFMGLAFKQSEAATKILESPTEMTELWSRLGMPESELPKVDWENETVVFVAQSRTRQTTLKPLSVTYNRQVNSLTIQLPSEQKPGKDQGMAWFLATFPRAGELNRDEQERLQKHQTFYEEFKVIPEDERLVIEPPPRLFVLSKETTAKVKVEPQKT